MPGNLAHDGIAQAQALKPEDPTPPAEPQPGELVPNIQARLRQLRAQGPEAVAAEVRRLLAQSHGPARQAVQMAMAELSPEERKALGGETHGQQGQHAPGHHEHRKGDGAHGDGAPAARGHGTPNAHGSASGTPGGHGSANANGGGNGHEAQPGQGAHEAASGGGHEAHGTGPAAHASGEHEAEHGATGQHGGAANAHGAQAHGAGPAHGGGEAEHGGGGDHGGAQHAEAPSPADQRGLIEEESEAHHKWKVLSGGSRADKARLLLSGGDFLKGGLGAVEQVAIGKGVQMIAKAIPIPGLANIIGGGMSAAYLFNGGAQQLATETAEGVHALSEMVHGHFSWLNLANFIGGVKAFIEMVGHIANIISGLCYGFAAIAAIGTLLAVVFPPLAACASAIPVLIDFGQLCGGIGSVALMIGSLMSPLPPLFRALHIVFSDDDPYKLMKQEEQFHEEAQGAIANYGAIGIQSAMSGKNPIKHIAGELHEGMESIHEGAGGLAGEGGSLGSQMSGEVAKMRSGVDESLGGSSNFNADHEGMGERGKATRDFRDAYLHGEGRGSFHDQERATEQHEQQAEAKAKASEQAQEHATEAQREQSQAEFEDQQAQRRLSHAQAEAQAEQQRMRAQQEEAQAKLNAAKDDPPLDALAKQAEAQRAIEESNRRVEEAQSERSRTQEELQKARHEAHETQEKAKEAQEEAREAHHEAHEAKEATERRGRHSTGGASGDAGGAAIGRAVANHEEHEREERNEQAEHLAGSAEGGHHAGGEHRGHAQVLLEEPPGTLEEIDQLAQAIQARQKLLPRQQQLTHSAHVVANDASSGVRALAGLHAGVMQEQQAKVQAGQSRQASVDAQTADVASKSSQGNAQTSGGIGQGTEKLGPVLSFAQRADGLAQRVPDNRWVNVGGVKMNIHKFRSGIETVLGAPSEHAPFQAAGQKGLDERKQKTQHAVQKRTQAVQKTNLLHQKISADQAKTQAAAVQAKQEAQRSQTAEMSIAQELQQLQQQKQQKWSALVGWAAQHREMRVAAMKRASEE